jgi:hypothetical protein
LTQQEIEAHRILGHLSNAQAAQAVPDCFYCGKPDCDQRELHHQWHRASETTWWRAAS